MDYLTDLHQVISTFKQVGYEYTETYKEGQRAGFIRVELAIVPIKGQSPFDVKSGLAVSLATGAQHSQDTLADARFALLKHVAVKLAEFWKEVTPDPDHRRRPKDGRPKFEINQKELDALVALYPDFREAAAWINGDQDPRVCGLKVGEVAEKACYGPERVVGVDHVSRAFGVSPATTHDARYVASVWSRKLVAETPLGWGVLVTIARGAVKMAKRSQKAVNEIAEFLGKKAIADSMSVREMRKHIDEQIKKI